MIYGTLLTATLSLAFWLMMSSPAMTEKDSEVEGSPESKRRRIGLDARNIDKLAAQSEPGQRYSTETDDEST